METRLSDRRRRDLKAAFIFGTKVAETISGKLIDESLLGSNSDKVAVICAGLLAAIIWNVITWLLALPPLLAFLAAARLGRPRWR